MVVITIDVPSFLMETSTLTILIIGMVTLFLVCGDKVYNAPKRDRKLDVPLINQKESEKENSSPRRHLKTVYRMDEETEITHENCVARSNIWLRRASWYSMNIISSCLFSNVSLKDFLTYTIANSGVYVYALTQPCTYMHIFLFQETVQCNC